MKRGTFKRKPYSEVLKRKQRKDRVVGKNTGNRAKQAKKTPSRSLSKLKRELDRVFSIFIRQKYPKRCYTCGKTEVTLQCGHFVTRQYLATRWDENNCRPQCVGCNMFGGGKVFDFEENLKRELGARVVEKIKLSRHKIMYLDRTWYEGQIEKYTSLTRFT